MNEDRKANTINGGTAVGDINDTISYENYLSGINVNLATTTMQTVVDYATGIDDTDRILNIEHLIGSQANDTISGSTANNTIEGGKGNDTFITSTGDGADYF